MLVCECAESTCTLLGPTTMPQTPRNLFIIVTINVCTCATMVVVCVISAHIVHKCILILCFVCERAISSTCTRKMMQFALCSVYEDIMHACVCVCVSCAVAQRKRKRKHDRPAGCLTGSLVVVISGAHVPTLTAT